MKILFIGAGNMAQSIINGIIMKNVFKNNNISIYDIDKDKRIKVQDIYKVEIQEKIDISIKEFDVIILAIKPQVFVSFEKDNIMKNLPDLIDKSQLIISIMAGLTIKSINNFFKGHENIIRVMPNTPALIGEAMSGVTSINLDSLDSLEIVKKIFMSIGEVVVIEEKLIDAITALSGSGPAYVFTFIEALTQGGILCGLTKQVAEKLAVQTIIGSALMVKNNEKTVEELRHMVTSPAGTTIEAIASLEKDGFRSSVIEAVRSAFNKARKL